MRLSILISHLAEPEREKSLERLMLILRPQLTPEVEVILNTDKGELTLGQKRRIQLKEAKGDYICFVDDDDIVPKYYVKEMLKALKTNPDVVGIKGLYKLGDNKPEPFIHSIKYSDWFTEDNVHYRCPNHLNPVRRELALQAGFNERSYGEDYDYSIRLKGLLKKEVFIKRIMYLYLK